MLGEFEIHVLLSMIAQYTILSISSNEKCRIPPCEMLGDFDIDVFVPQKGQYTVLSISSNDECKIYKECPYCCWGAPDQVKLSCHSAPTHVS